ncbi:radical SAM/SPASM domain-containing protein [Clostridium oryzae]|uniref:Pyrroloquinoline quinone biosynthesis protein PqqE n=1 Tax=Clostridium oryzae TaxID=1450648 RepID=A0A1V4IJ66_9CLOT|nr:SPASM domain-containing protein [Clostridium oryzae]OPJ59973.1 pyrroloquinoline quinone biosynthesis protein PqqE [Clostridium oryzae]
MLEKYERDGQMKVSKYNVNIDINENEYIIYNTFTRKYLKLQSIYKSHIENLINNLTRVAIAREDINIIKNMVEKGIVIRNEVDELEIIKNREVLTRFQEYIFYLSLQPILKCNFNYKYCSEACTGEEFSTNTVEKIIRFAENVTKKVHILQVSWFAGESPIQFKNMMDITQKLKRVCNKNNCQYRACITINGYLLSENYISRLPELSIESIQIAIDDAAEYNDRQKSLGIGEEKFDRVLQNILLLLNKRINLVLKINVTDENYNSVIKVLELIPVNKRKDVTLNMVSFSQGKNSIKLFDLYKKAIGKGFDYYNIKNRYQNCEACFKNSINIEPDENLCTCPLAGEDGFYIGKLGSDGEIQYSNAQEFLKFINLSAIDNENCRNCIQLPMCMGGCKYSRYKDSKVCNALSPNVLSLEEKILLHYYTDNNPMVYENDTLAKKQKSIVYNYGTNNGCQRG